MPIRSRLLKAGLPVLILLLCLVVTFIMIQGQDAPEQEQQVRKPMLVEVISVSRQPVVYTIRSQGSVMPKFRSDLTTEVSGRVEAVSKNFVAGGFVRKGEVLVQLEQADYQTELKAAEATLYGARAALEEEKARAKVAEEDWRQYSAEEIPELGLRKPQLAKEMANLSYAHAQLDRAKRNLERTQIRAPYDAILRTKEVDVGEFLSRGTNVAELFGTDVAEVRLPITDTELAYLELGDDPSAATVLLTSNIGNKQFEWAARLARSEGIIDEQSRFIYAVIEVDDPYLRGASNAENQTLLPLKFGRFVGAEIVGTSERNMIRLPRKVVRGGDQVVVVTPENTVARRTIVVERSERDYVYVRDGLDDGERVAVTPIASLPNGSPVRVSDDTDVTEAGAE
ncbi:efflux RND transporter periplasmic adaptor subunit [Neiella marina]|uniref:Efflux RND transporter periplasmic adaptor subunit n=1 Tax=Neiella holothuriorum TaxID=2870530 RepID=A0ABS7EJW4_9GAMM|nr:efflux RND transporter periplasmic adaptor subunit [Neiella holothuriorum]MBW8192158.1 efflux RND transporter periplasmic adaptor subunit [Neiella holothuriorum]